MKRVLKVSRLKIFLNHNFNANFFGRLYEKDKKICYFNLYKHYLKSLCKNLKNWN